MVYLSSTFFRCCVFLFTFFELLIYNMQMMFQTRMLLGRMGIYDQYQDWRLDVDNMTYEVPSHCIPIPRSKIKQKRFYAYIIAHYFILQELLDLEDRIGYVSTGLREDEIIQSLRMVKYSAFNPRHFSTEMDRRCSICQVCPFSFSFPLTGLTSCTSARHLIHRYRFHFLFSRKSSKYTRKLGS